MKPNSLQELYIEQLQDLYDAEHQIIKALPKMIAEATSTGLKDALTEHLERRHGSAPEKKRGWPQGAARAVNPPTGNSKSY